MKGRLLCIAFAGLVAASSAASPVFAQDYPARPIRIVTTAAGGTHDIVSRILAPELDRLLGQRGVVVENRPGAGGQVTADAVARAAPDGYTLLISAGVSLSPAFIKKPLVLLKDLSPISLLAEGPLVLVAPKSLPADSMAELYAYAASHPGQLNYASNGPGLSTTLYAETIVHNQHLKMQEIPYPGSNAITEALLRNDVQFAFLGVGSGNAYITKGGGKPLAVTGKKRLKQFPNTPTFYETGTSGIESFVIAMHAPANTPNDIVTRLNSAVVQAGNKPEFAGRMDGLSLVAVLSSPDELRQREAADSKWAVDAAKAVGIEPL